MTTTTAPPVREETLAEIRELEKEIAEAERKHNIHKGHAKEYKAEFDSLVGQLRDKCRSLSDPMPLYETNGHAEADGWRTIPIDEALPDLPAAVRQRLTEAELPTVGSIADYTAAEKRLTDLPGIGKAKAELIEKSLERFWEKRKESENAAERADGNANRDRRWEEAEENGESDGPDAA